MKFSELKIGKFFIEDSDRNQYEGGVRVYLKINKKWCTRVNTGYLYHYNELDTLLLPLDF